MGFDEAGDEVDGNEVGTRRARCLRFQADTRLLMIYWFGLAPPPPQKAHLRLSFLAALYLPVYKS
jgi:hypothetical protein